MRSVPGKIDHDEILQRYWHFANLEAEETKGNILGQLKALDTLLEQTPRPAPIDDKPLPAPNIYQSAWMKTQQ
jgi:hypothetical protein